MHAQYSQNKISASPMLVVQSTRRPCYYSVPFFSVDWAMHAQTMLYNEIHERILLERTIWLNQKLKDNGNNVKEVNEWCQCSYVTQHFECHSNANTFHHFKSNDWGCDSLTQSPSLGRCFWCECFAHTKSTRWPFPISFSRQFKLNGEWLFTIRTCWTLASTVNWPMSSSLLYPLFVCWTVYFIENHQNGYLWLMVAYVFVRMGVLCRFSMPVVHSPSKNVHRER